MKAPNATIAVMTVVAVLSTRIAPASGTALADTTGSAGRLAGAGYHRLGDLRRPQCRGPPVKRVALPRQSWSML